MKREKVKPTNKIVLLSVLAALTLITVTATAYSATASEVWFEPDPSSVPGCGDTIDVQILLNATESVNGFDIWIDYDPGCANITGATAGDFPSVFLVTYKTDAMHIIGTTTDFGDITGDRLKLATITIEGVECSSYCQTTLDLNDSCRLGNAAGGNPLATWKDGTFSCGAQTGSISGKVTYTCNTTGIAGATVNLTQGGSVINSTATNSNGEYTFTNVPLGAYAVNASKLRFWDNATDVTVTAGEPAEANMMLWLKGDLYNDGVLDIYDIIMLRQAAAENIPWDYRYDLYVDEIVDIYDIIVLRQAVAGNIVLE